MARRCPRTITLALTGLALMPALAWGELAVIYDSGNTQPLAPFLEILEDSEAPTGPHLGAANINTLLPVRSPGLTPGPVQQRALNRPFARPFFLIGSDPLSRKWLSRHREQLMVIGAVGMLVEAKTVDDLRAVARLAGGLPVMPASATDIAEALGVSHYPVLISAKGIEQ